MSHKILLNFNRHRHIHDVCKNACVLLYHFVYNKACFSVFLFFSSGHLFFLSIHEQQTGEKKNTW